jgi:lipopolysaccharide transport system permease protein
MFNRGGEDFVVFLLIGVTHWLWFSKSVSNATTSILLGSNLMVQTQISKLYFPLVIVIEDAIKQVPVFVLLVLFLFFYGIPLTESWLAWPIIIICELLLILSFSIITAAVLPFLPDLHIFISTGLQFMMFVSGVFFSFELIPEYMRDVFFWNPMARILKLARESLLGGSWPDWYMLGELFLYSGVALIIVIWMLSRIGHIYPRLVSG